MKNTPTPSSFTLFALLYSVFLFFPPDSYPATQREESNWEIFTTADQNIQYKYALQTLMKKFNHEKKNAEIFTSEKKGIKGIHTSCKK